MLFLQSALEQFLGHDLQSALLIVLNLILIESLLSVDNAAVLATMVMDLPESQRPKALKYGILGAYIFRGLCLIFAYWLIKIWWIKPLGGLYLLYITVNYFFTKSTPDENDDTLNKSENIFYKYTLGLLGPFWATVALVELMDLAFSIDNVFAAVAYTKSIVLICLGVFIGILTMRFVAQGFITLMEKYPFLETVAFLVIGILGLKLTSSLYTHYFPQEKLSVFLESHEAEWYISILTVSIFVIPILYSIVSDKLKRS